MRAGRLLGLLLALQGGHRLTAAELGRRLEVSQRTVLRDIDLLSASGVPVYAVRGPGGGFELLETFEQQVPRLPPGLSPARGRRRRVRVRLAPAALQVAMVTGSPGGWRSRPGAVAVPDRPDWLEGSFRFVSQDAAVRELLALGAEVEVLAPAQTREAMAAIGQRVAALHTAAQDCA